MGYGIAGVCGAIEAREAGAEVLVLERASGCAGSTSIASGHFYLGGGTAVQRACGFEDSASDLAAYLTATTAVPDAAKIEAFANGSVALFEWLEERGVPFERSYFPTKAVIQHGTECLIWTGNEKVWPYCGQARPAPRGHKVAFEGTEGAGGLALKRLVSHAASIGVRAHYDTAVEALVIEKGRIVGVRARHFGVRQCWRARCGVLLAGGGFGNNAEMVEEHLRRFAGVNVMAGPYDDGTAIRLGRAAGGALEHMDGMLVTSPIYPPEQLVKGILINREGRRFVAEDSYHTRTSLAIIDQPLGIAYLVLDAGVFAYPEWHEYANQRLVDGFASIGEMAEWLAIPAGALERTLDNYNRAARSGDDPDFHKQREWLKPLDEALGQRSSFRSEVRCSTPSLSVDCAFRRTLRCLIATVVRCRGFMQPGPAHRCWRTTRETTRRASRSPLARSSDGGPVGTRQTWLLRKADSKDGAVRLLQNCAAATRLRRSHQAPANLRPARNSTAERANMGMTAHGTGS